MSEEVDKKEPDTDQPQTPDTPPEAKNTDTPGPVPYDRFKAVNDEAKQLKARISELEKAETERTKEQDAAEKKRLKEQQKWQELAEQHEAKVGQLEPELATVKAELEAANAALASYASAQIEHVPEMYRPLVESLPVLKQLEWLTENGEKLTQKPQPNGGPTTPKAKGKGDLTPEQRRKAAKSFW